MAGNEILNSAMTTQSSVSAMSRILIDFELHLEKT